MNLKTRMIIDVKGELEAKGEGNFFQSVLFRIVIIGVIFRLKYYVDLCDAVGQKFTVLKRFFVKNQRMNKFTANKKKFLLAAKIEEISWKDVSLRIAYCEGTR